MLRQFPLQKRCRRNSWTTSVYRSQLMLFSKKIGRTILQGDIALHTPILTGRRGVSVYHMRVFWQFIYPVRWDRPSSGKRIKSRITCEGHSPPLQAATQNNGVVQRFHVLTAYNSCCTAATFWLLWRRPATVPCSFYFCLFRVLKVLRSNPNFYYFKKHNEN
jgi:hypothetical protein